MRDAGQAFANQRGQNFIRSIHDIAAGLGQADSNTPGIERVDTALEEIAIGKLIEMFGDQTIRQPHLLGDYAGINGAAIDRMENIVKPEIDALLVTQKGG